MKNSEIKKFIDMYPDGEAIAMALLYFMSLKSGKILYKEESFIL
jgi:hypothetical protein